MSRLYNIPYAVENRIKVLKKKFFFLKQESVTCLAFLMMEASGQKVNFKRAVLEPRRPF